MLCYDIAFVFNSKEAYWQPWSMVFYFCFVGSGNEKSQPPSFEKESDQHCHEHEYVSTLEQVKLLATKINILMFENNV